MANIVMIDDDKQLLKMMGMMLERGGHSTTLIDDPQTGLETIRRQRPDVLVVDVMMPGTSGHEVCRQVRATPEVADLPILVLTARAQDVDREAALKSGADDYLSKPVTAQELMEHIDRLLLAKSNPPPDEPEATALTLYSMRGGSGRTTLAVNLAAALRRLSNEEVLLVDLSPSGGQAALHLRLQSRNSWLDLVESNALEWDELARICLLHQSGLRVLAAPPQPQRSHLLTAALVQKIRRAARPAVGYIVFDLPALWNEATVAALQASDIVLHVINPEVISIQAALQSNHLLAELSPPLKQKAYVLNQVAAEAQLPLAAVERGLNTRLAFQIGHESRQSRALAQGVPLTLTVAKAGLPESIRRLAEAINQRLKKEAAPG